MVTIHIEVISDTLCPWCYVAKANLDRAIALHRRRDPDAVFHVVWKPFYLYPSLPPTDHPRAVLYPFAPDIQSRLATAAREALVPISLASLTAGTAGNSRPSHQLLRHLARSRPVSPGSTPSPRTTSSSAPFPPVPGPGPGHGHAQPFADPPPAYSTAQSRFLDGLFDAYFARGLDVSNTEVLLGLAARAGLGRAEASRVLESEESRRGTDEEAARARGERGVEGVPTMTIQGRWRVGGMQGVDLLLGVFEKVAAGGVGGGGVQCEGAGRKGSRGSEMWLKGILDGEP